MNEFSTYLHTKVAPSTVKRYEFELTHFFLSLERKGIAPKTATHNQIVAYIGERRKGYKNKLSIVSTVQAIKQYYGFLVFSGKRKDNPAKSIKLRDKQTKDIQLQDLFTTEELAELLNRKERYPILRNRNQIILSLLIYQGLTSGEIKKLEINDLDLQQGTIFIRGSRKINQRTLKLHPSQLYKIITYLQQDRPQLMKSKTEKLIINKLGTPETGEGIHYIVGTCRHLFPDRKLNPQTIRQSVIANLLKQGKDLRIVQEFAGHKTPSTTENYKQSQSEELKIQILKYHPLQ